jgi:saccharopine dehydrogenase-like NADP-dependent oxidoreductase
MRLARAMLESGLYSDKPIRIKGQDTNAFELLFEVLLAAEESKHTPVWAYGLVVRVTGKHAGNLRVITLWNRHPGMEEWGGAAAYYKNIAIPLSIGAEMIARGDVGIQGIVPPETALEPEIFIGELHRRGIEIHIEIQEKREL